MVSIMPVTEVAMALKLCVVHCVGQSGADTVRNFSAFSSPVSSPIRFLVSSSIFFYCQSSLYPLFADRTVPFSLFFHNLLREIGVYMLYSLVSQIVAAPAEISSVAFHFQLFLIIPNILLGSPFTCYFSLHILFRWTLSPF